jgi:hypothetical protein
VVRAVARVVIVIVMVTPWVIVTGVGFLLVTEVLVGLPIIRQLSVSVHLPFTWRWMELMV